MDPNRCTATELGYRPGRIHWRYWAKAIFWLVIVPWAAFAAVWLIATR